VLCFRFLKGEDCFSCGFIRFLLVFLGLEHYRYRFGEWLHTEIERVIQSLKDRVECFDNELRRDAAYNTSEDG
jgi:hypothetical protein